MPLFLCRVFRICLAEILDEGMKDEGREGREGNIPPWTQNENFPAISETAKTQALWLCWGCLVTFFVGSVFFLLALFSATFDTQAEARRGPLFPPSSLPNPIQHKLQH